MRKLPKSVKWGKPCMSWQCTASIYQSQSLSQCKKVETKESHFVPNESFPLEILPSIKNQIKHWTGAFDKVHPPRNTHTHTLLICDLLCSWCVGSIGVLLSERWFIRSTVGIVCVCMCMYLPLHMCHRVGVKQSMQPSFTAVGQPSHTTAGDQCQTGKVTGLQSALTPS